MTFALSVKTFSSPWTTMDQTVEVWQMCTNTTSFGQRCQFRTCQGPECALHLYQNNGLCIKASGIPGAGLGLFAAQTFRKGDAIGEYTGEELSLDALTERYGSALAAYTLCDGTRYIDARNSNSCAVRFANDARGTDKRNNATFVPSTFILEATKTIGNGSEIFVNYGDEYWDAFQTDIF